MPNPKLLTSVLTALLFTGLNTADAIPDPDDDGNSSAWIALYSVSPSFAKVGNPVPVQWQSVATVGCSIWTNQTGSRSVPTSGSTTITPNSASTMSVRLTCAGVSGQTVSQTRSFSVNQADHPELLSLNTNASVALVGSQVTVSWSSAFSDFCSLWGTNAEILPPSGSRVFVVQNGSNEFNMQCKTYDGRASNSLYKSVVGQLPAGPVIHFMHIEYSGIHDPNYYVRWQADAEYCILDFGQFGASGNVPFPKIGVPIPHNLTCYKNGLTASASRLYQPGSNGITPPDDVPTPIGGGDDSGDQE